MSTVYVNVTAGSPRVSGGSNHQVTVGSTASGDFSFAVNTAGLNKGAFEAAAHAAASALQAAGVLK